MSTLRLSLAGTITLMLLGGLSGGVAAQEAPADPMASAYFTAEDTGDVPSQPGRWLMEATDARISGTVTQGPEEGASLVGPSVWRSTIRIDNDLGAWEGVDRGFAAGDDILHWNEVSWLVGEGAYEGLSAVLSGSTRAGDLGSYLLEGVIFPGEPPPAE